MATQNLKLLREILGRLWDYDRDAALPESFRELAQRATDSTAGCSPAKYCMSNARSAAATVGPIPTIPSSTLGPTNAIQSSPRKNNRGRRTADGLPGWAVQ